MKERGRMNNFWNTTSFDVNGILGTLGNILGALIVFLIGWLIAKLIANGIQKALEKSEPNKTID